jgi:hypothetical protein
MPSDDRTTAFFAVADALCQLRDRAPTPRPKPQRTTFGAASSRVGQAIHKLDSRIGRLSKLASKSSMFDDPVVEIAEISALIKGQLGAIGQSVEALARGYRPGGAQRGAHSEAVLAYLKTWLQRGTEAFQAALQKREAILSAKEGFASKLSSMAATPAPALNGAAGHLGTPRTGGGAFAGAAGMATPGGGASLLQRRRRHPMYATPQAACACGDGGFGGCGYSESPSSSSVAIDMGGYTPGAVVGQQQQTFWTPRSHQHRQEEMGQMQSTMAELGNMFQQFTSLVAEQASAEKTTNRQLPRPCARPAVVPLMVDRLRSTLTPARRP